MVLPKNRLRFHVINTNEDFKETVLQLITRMNDIVIKYNRKTFIFRKEDSVDWMIRAISNTKAGLIIEVPEDTNRLLLQDSLQEVIPHAGIIIKQVD